MGPEPLSEERRELFLWRYWEARRLGLGRWDASLFADSDADLNDLRRLAENECPPKLALRIVL